MSDYDIMASSYENTIGSLTARIQILCSKLSDSIAPAFYGARITRESMEEVLSNIPEGNELTVFVPSADVFIKMWIGDGTNADSLCEGCDWYIQYNVYNSDFEEIDGGQMDYNEYRAQYRDDIRRAAVDVVGFACGSGENRYPTFIPLKSNK